ncbi:MAG: GNAT family N-acetyltransferase [Alkalibacterium sp.]|nr:GNAT family N-acetyltransferase [Alkalibacterium sp.]
MFQYKINDQISLKLKDFHDTEELYALIDSSRDHLKEWMPWAMYTKDENDVASRTQQSLLDFAHQKGMHYVIIVDDHIVGSVSLKQFNWTVKSAEIGYWIAPEFQGKGIMTKAVKALLVYGFDYLKLNKLEVWAAAENKRSRSIPERLDFVEEGRRRANEYIDEKYFDMILYGLLKSEWEEQSDRYGF